MCESIYCNESETMSHALQARIKLAEIVLHRAVGEVPGRAGKKVSKTYNAGHLITPELRKSAVIEALNLYNADYGEDIFYLKQSTYNRVTSLVRGTKISDSHVDALVDALVNYVLREAEFALRCREGRVGEYEKVLNMSGSVDFWTGRILACKSAQERKSVYDEINSIDYIAFHRWDDVACRLGNKISLSDFTVDDYDFIVRYDDYGSSLNELFERAMEKGDDDIAARLNAGIKEYPYAMHYNANEVLPFIDKYPTPGNADTAINLLLGDYKKEEGKKRKNIVDELLKHVERKPDNYSMQDEYDERADGFAVAAKILEVFINESASSVQFERLLETSLFKEDNYKRVVNFLQDSDIVSDGLLLPLLGTPAIREIAVELTTTSNKVLHYINVMETWLKDDVTRVKIAAHPNADANLLAVHAAGEYGEEATLAAINNPNLPIERAIHAVVDKITPRVAVAVATRPDALPAHILILIAQGDTDVTNALLEHPSTKALVKAYLPTRKK